MNDVVQARLGEIRAELIRQQIAVFMTDVARGATEVVAEQSLRARLSGVPGIKQEEIKQAVSEGNRVLGEERARKEALLKATQGMTASAIFDVNKVL